MDTTNPPAVAPARPLTLARCWDYAAAHAEAARLRLTGPGPDYRGARAHATLAQAYATLAAAAVAAHPQQAGALRALTQRLYDPDET
jgi:hypothetical protein